MKEEHIEEDDSQEKKENRVPSVHNIGNGIEQTDVSFCLELVERAEASNPQNLEKQA